MQLDTGLYNCHGGLHVTKAAHIRHLLKRLLGQVQIVVWLDDYELPRLTTLQKPTKAHHIALLLHLGLELVVLLSCNDVSHILCPVLIHLRASTKILQQQPYIGVICQVLHDPAQHATT